MEWNKQGHIGMKHSEKQAGFNTYSEHKDSDLIDHQKYILIIDIKASENRRQ